MRKSRPSGRLFLLCPNVTSHRRRADGELVESPSPKVRHQQLVGRLFIAFADHVNTFGSGTVLMAPMDTVFSPMNVTQPDLLFIADDRSDVLTEANVQGAPSLCIEVISDSRRDRVRKKAIYERFGVEEYWIVDPEIDRVEIYRLAGDSYDKPGILDGDDVLTYSRLPGLEIPLRELFARG
ncbi:MAG: Uma2 family endonuclease [Actinomycetota bacterium]